MSYLLIFVMFCLYVVTIYGYGAIDYAGAYISIVILPYVLYDLLVSSGTASEVWARSVCAGMLFTMAFVRLLLRSIYGEGTL